MNRQEGDRAGASAAAEGASVPSTIRQSQSEARLASSPLRGGRSQGVEVSPSFCLPPSPFPSNHHPSLPPLRGECGEPVASRRARAPICRPPRAIGDSHPATVIMHLQRSSSRIERWSNDYRRYRNRRVGAMRCWTCKQWWRPGTTVSLDSRLNPFREEEDLSGY